MKKLNKIIWTKFRKAFYKDAKARMDDYNKRKKREFKETVGYLCDRIYRDVKYSVEENKLPLFIITSYPDISKFRIFDSSNQLLGEYNASANEIRTAAKLFNYRNHCTAIRGLVTATKLELTEI